jgi:hypothetical protein
VASLTRPWSQCAREADRAYRRRHIVLARRRCAPACVRPFRRRSAPDAALLNRGAQPLETFRRDAHRFDRRRGLQCHIPMCSITTILPLRRARGAHLGHTPGLDLARCTLPFPRSTLGFRRRRADLSVLSMRRCAPEKDEVTVAGRALSEEGRRFARFPARLCFRAKKTSSTRTVHAPTFSPRLPYACAGGAMEKTLILRLRPQDGPRQGVPRPGSGS